MGKTSRRAWLDFITTIISATAAVFTASLLVDQWGIHQEALKRNLEPAQQDVTLINRVLKASGHTSFLTSDALKEYAKQYSTSLFDAAIESPKAEQKSPEDQDTIHRLQLLEIKSDRLESQLTDLSKSHEQPWWKEPKALWLVAIFFILEKIFSRVVGDLVGIAWEWLAEKMGLTLPSKKAE